jgi:hypothetical protein
MTVQEFNMPGGYRQFQPIYSNLFTSLSWNILLEAKEADKLMA